MLGITPTPRGYRFVIQSSTGTQATVRLAYSYPHHQIVNALTLTKISRSWLISKIVRVR
jgi:hypothetical protein